MELNLFVFQEQCDQMIWEKVAQTLTTVVLTYNISFLNSPQIRQMFGLIL